MSPFLLVPNAEDSFPVLLPQQLHHLEQGLQLCVADPVVHLSEIPDELRIDEMPEGFDGAASFQVVRPRITVDLIEPL